jgi:hypothetical protein
MAKGDFRCKVDRRGRRGNGMREDETLFQWIARVNALKRPRNPLYRFLNDIDHARAIYELEREVERLRLQNDVGSSLQE